MAKLLSLLFSRPSGVVVASTIGVALGITSTVTAVFSLFLVPISQEFDSPRSSVSVVLIFIAIANALVYPLLGRLADRLGARKLVLIGIVLFVMSMASVSAVSGLLQFYIAYACIGITGSTLGPILFAKTIAGWFNKNRGLFLGVMGGVGNGVGSTLMPIYALLLMTHYGWRSAYQGIAILILLIGLPVLFFLLRDPEPHTVLEQHGESNAVLGFTFAEARATSVFWLVLVAISLCSGCLLGVFTHVVPMLTDRGIAIHNATAVLATFAMVTVVAQVGVGALLDKVSGPRLVAVLFVIALIGLAVFVSASSITWLVVSGALMGVGLGAEFGLLPYCISRYFGLKDYGSIVGFVYAVVALSTGFMPVLMDVVFDVSGNYDLAVAAIFVGMLAGAGIIARLPAFDLLMTSRFDAVKPNSKGA